MGAHIATIPFSVLARLAAHPMTDKGIRSFLDDWNKRKKGLTPEQTAQRAWLFALPIQRLRSSPNAMWETLLLGIEGTLTPAAVPIEKVSGISRCACTAAGQRLKTMTSPMQ